MISTMKKRFFTVAAALTAAPLFAQTISWDLSPVTASLRTLVPNLLGLLCFVALFGWTIWNLSNAGWALVIIAVGYGMVYGAMNVLLR